MTTEQDGATYPAATVVGQKFKTLRLVPYKQD